MGTNSLAPAAGVADRTRARSDEIAIATNDIAPSTTGKAELRGTSWNARNDSDAAIPSGARCVVTKVDGLTLIVKPE